MRLIAVAAICAAVAVGGCEQLQQLGAAQAVYGTVTSPSVSVGDKACAVVEWGVPLALSRAGTFTPTQQRYIDFARQVAAEGCRIPGATNSQRVAAAADAVSKALWKLVP